MPLQIIFKDSLSRYQCRDPNFSFSFFSKLAKLS